MKIRVLARPGRRRESIEWDGERLVVTVAARAVEGEANKAVVAAVAIWLGIPKSRVEVVRGVAAREKTLEVDVTAEEFAAAVARL